MFVRVRTPKSSRKNVVRIGEEVIVHSTPGKTPLSRVDTSTSPVIAAVRQVDGRKLATVEYRDTEDGDTHLMELPPSSLRGGEETLNIGDKVMLLRNAPSVCVTVGSRGTVVGGKDTYTVVFEMTHSNTGEELEHAVTVTQDQVPCDVLRFEAEAEDESSSDSDSDMDVEEMVGGGGSVLTTLKQRLPPRVLDEVMLLLNLTELDEVASILTTTDADPDTTESVLFLLN